MAAPTRNGIVMRWEMGSEFHLLTDIPATDSNHTPFQGEVFVNGRAALRSVVERLDQQPPSFWIPSYVCEDVFDVLSPRFNLKVYGDYPDEYAPRFESLAPSPGDAVLVQDTFGLGNVDQWREWSIQHPEVVLVEDISHSCSQERYLQSPADYVLSSLRKSLPAADGGIVFSDQGGLRLAPQGSLEGSHLKLEAMILKSLYLQGILVNKSVYRDLQISGEQLLCRVDQGGAISHTLQMVETLPHDSIRSRWNDNNMNLRSRFEDGHFGATIQLLNPRSANQGLFHSVIQCNSNETRNALRQHLISNSVFPAVHWPQNHNAADPRSVELGETLLTLPTDYRYGEEDIDRLASILEEGVRTL